MRVNNRVDNIDIFLKNNNERLIALIHNLVFHFKIKHIDIEHHYLSNRIASSKIQLFYIPIKKIIINNFTKTLIYIKFYYFSKQINMTYNLINIVNIIKRIRILQL